MTSSHLIVPLEDLLDDPERILGWYHGLDVVHPDLHTQLLQTIRQEVKRQSQSRQEVENLVTLPL